MEYVFIFILVAIVIIYLFKSMAKEVRQTPKVEITCSWGESEDQSNYTPNTLPRFVGKGGVLKIGGYVINDPMTYVLEDRSWDGFDASLICTKRPIGKTDRSELYPLSYWPTTYDLNSSQFGYYLSWLASGKNASDIELGYVFLYFYGLERRALADQKDILEVSQEILRLLKIYNHSKSFVNYSTGLLLHLVGLDILKPKKKLFDKIICERNGYVDEYLRLMMLNFLAKFNQPLPADWAFELAKQDERTINSVVAKRAPEELLKVFTIRYEQQIQEKMIPKLGSSQTSIEYHAASPTLLQGYGYSNDVPEAYCATVIGWKRQFQPIVRLYNECIEDLKDFSRNLAKKAPEASIVYESLPTELQDEVEHPKQDAWSRILEQYSKDDGICFVPVNEIAKMRNIKFREKLTITQSRSIAGLVETLGNAIEPDPRYTGRALKWTEDIAILKLPEDPQLPQSQNYALTSLIVPLALEISLADGSHDEEERQVITIFLQERFMLTQNECIRLEALIDYHMSNDLKMTGLKNKIAQNFSATQRKALGKFLVLIAGAVDGVCPEETEALEKTFKALDLDKDMVTKFIKELGFDKMIKPQLVIKGKPDEGEKIPVQAPALDLARIRQIHAESVEASKLLVDAMEKNKQEDIQEEKSPHLVNEKAKQNINLQISPELHPFFFDLVNNTRWSTKEINELAKQHKTTVSAAIEEINSWSDEQLGDFLIEEGEPVLINSELLEQIGSAK